MIMFFMLCLCVKSALTAAVPVQYPYPQSPQQVNKENICACKGKTYNVSLQMYAGTMKIRY